MHCASIRKCFWRVSGGSQSCNLILPLRTCNPPFVGMANVGPMSVRTAQCRANVGPHFLKFMCIIGRRIKTYYPCLSAAWSGVRRRQRASLGQPVRTAKNSSRLGVLRAWRLCAERLDSAQARDHGSLKNAVPSLDAVGWFFILNFIET